jgi:hypothetical protein
MNLHALVDSSLEAFECSARPVYLPIGRLGEKICIALVGSSSTQSAWARATTLRPLACLPNDLGHAAFSFGGLVVADYQEWCARGKAPQDWSPPIAGLTVGDTVLAEGFDAEDAVRVACSLAALVPTYEVAASKEEPVSVSPRTSEEKRFLESVKIEIGKSRPSLVRGFRRGLSLTGKAVGGEIDFVGSHYVTCYAAVNPRGKAASRVQAASAALWRLARARDAFGFATPAAIELTAWVPPEGLPIYSDQDYRVAAETVAELREQASREQLEVFAVPDVSSACRRLVDIEVSRAPVHS